MRLEEDLMVANAFDNDCDPMSRINLILGGHDHESMIEGKYRQGCANCFEETSGSSNQGQISGLLAS
ncbi:hypothetical protein L218DRAFT_172259 [Marasmius fiardii PR-910]|nr:hypothetical protein L218DRAFT_172259 [Marasmius fiardii PR-910]